MPDPVERRFVVHAIVASQFGPPFMFSGVAVALPAIGADLEAGATSLGLIETLFLAGSLAFLLPIGWLADASDKRTLYKLGLIAFGVTSVAIGLLSWLPAILAIRFLQGVASATFAATGPAILADLVPAERRGRVYGASIGAIYAGLTLGPVAAGWLIDALGWRSVFFVSAAAILAGYVLVAPRLPSRWRPPTGRVHAPSVLLLLVAVLSLVAGTATLQYGVLGYVAVGCGIAASVAFVAWQRRIPFPLLDVRSLMRNHVLRRALLVQLLLYMNAFSTIFMLSVYMQVTLARDARIAGQVLAVSSVLMAIMAPFSGALADRLRPGAVSGTGVLGVLLSAALAMTLDASSSLWLVAGVLALQGVGFALFSSPNMTVIMNSVSSNSTGTAAALGAKSRSLGMVSGMLVTTLLVSLAIGNDAVERHPLVFADTMRTMFGILTVLSVLALIAALRRSAAVSRDA